MLAGDLLLSSGVLTAELPPLELPGGPTATISGTVYETASTSSDASRLSDVRVQLLSVGGTVLDEQITGGDGSYHFDVLPGAYTVRQQIPDDNGLGNARVGIGGGVALGPNQITEIVIHWGETLAGYDFYELIPAVEVTPAEVLAVPFVQLPTPAQFEAPARRIFRSEFATATTRLPTATQQFDLPQRARQEAIFGGSSQPIRAKQEARGLEDDSFDGWFSTASYWELAEANHTAAEALEPLLEGIDDDESTDPRDAPFVDGYTDGYTAESHEWLPSAAESALDENWDGSGPSVATLTARLKQTPQVARRYDSHGRDARPPRQAARPKVVPTEAKSGRTAGQQRAAAVDEALTDDAPRDSAGADQSA